MAIKIVCDRCGKEIFDNAAKHKNQKYDLGPYHFCGGCMADFDRWINGSSN